MKTNLFAFFCCIYFSIATFAQCPTGDITFYNQASIDQFAIDHPTCTQIPGNMIVIYGADITNLNGLSNITSIGGYLWIYYNHALTNFSGLNNLTNIGSYLFINQNNNLNNLNGLNSLTTIGGALQIEHNHNLQNLSGLNSLVSVKNFYVLDNLSLMNLNGLNNLNSIGNGELYIKDNPALTNISGLSNINPHTISGGVGLYIGDNAQLSLCNLPNLCTYLSYDPSTYPRIINNNLGSCTDAQSLLSSCGVLGVAHNVDENKVEVYQQNQQIVINSKKYKINALEIYDAVGRTIFKNNTINKTQIKIPSHGFGAQILILKTQMENGKVVTTRVTSSL